jgi:hypothetical protein
MWAGEEKTALKRSRDYAYRLLDTLKAKLVEEMEKNGPAGAILVCSEIGTGIPEELTREDPAASIRRVSLKNRNPKNVPDPFEKKILSQMEEDLAKGDLKREYFEVMESNGTKMFRYMKPILTGSLCLNCHGTPDMIEPEVQRVLDEKYPDDKAVGYHVDQLRGAVTVRMRLE